MKRDELQSRLSALPKVDKLLDHERVKELLTRVDRAVLHTLTLKVIDDVRQSIIDSQKSKGTKRAPDLKSFIDTLVRMVDDLLTDRLVRVINATGTILHTNLGRAPLGKGISQGAGRVSSCYTNLEFDLRGGRRGHRYSHFEKIVKLVTGAQAALAVNNNAAAVLLVLNTLCEGKEAVVSRGELIEIGGSFRIPEVMKKSQAVLKEVGTTNKTHLKDYESAITDKTGLLLKVHTSNYRIVGFTKEVTLAELVALGKERGTVVYNDLGSGCLVDL